MEIKEVNDLLLKTQTLIEVFNNSFSYGEFKKKSELIGDYTKQEISNIWDILLMIDDIFKK